MHTLQTLSSLPDLADYSFAFRNFLDAFYAQPDVAKLWEMPDGPDRTRNAYLAATCDYLCNKYHFIKPAWLALTDDEDHPLIAYPPFFAATYWKTRLWLLVDSPQEFRQRNIFVGADALSRT